MSTIAAPNLSARDTETSLHRSLVDQSREATDASADDNKNPSPAASRSPTDRVELSDRAQRILEQNKADKTAADTLAQLVREMKAQGSKGKLSTYSPKAMPSGQTDAATTGDETVDAVKAMARMPAFATAADGRTDDTVRALVRDGKLPQLPMRLTDEQAAQLSDKEKTLFTIVQGLQGLYDAMPKSLDDALARHVKLVTDTYPDMIDRVRSDLAAGKYRADLVEITEQQLARHEVELAAARAGTMKVMAETDTTLVRGVSEFTMQKDAIGYSGRGQTTNADIKGVISKYGTENISVGSSPYTTGWVITW